MLVLTSSSPERGGGPPQVVEGHPRPVLTSRGYACGTCPSTMLRMVPLPVPGRNYCSFASTSYASTAAATAALRLSARPFIGIVTRKSQAAS